MTGCHASRSTCAPSLEPPQSRSRMRSALPRIRTRSAAGRCCTCRSFGYKGKVYPINPKRSEAQGFKAYPEPRGAARCAGGRDHRGAGRLAVEAVEECARRGVKVAIVMTSGFGETGDAVAARPSSGAWRERGARQRHAHDRPEHPGARQLRQRRGAELLHHVHRGRAAGRPGGRSSARAARMSVVPYGLLRARGIGVRHVARHRQRLRRHGVRAGFGGRGGPGSEAAAALSRDHPRPGTLAETARIAHARGLPVIALKSGRTAGRTGGGASRTPARSRTRTGWWTPSSSKHGIWRARDVGELVRARRAVSEGLEAEGAPAGGDQQLRRDLRDGGRRRHRAGHADGEARRGHARGAGEDPAELRHHHQPDRHHRGAADQQRAVRRRSCR